MQSTPNQWQDPQQYGGPAQDYNQQYGSSAQNYNQQYGGPAQNNNQQYQQPFVPPVMPVQPAPKKPRKGKNILWIAAVLVAYFIGMVVGINTVHTGSAPATSTSNTVATQATKATQPAQAAHTQVATTSPATSNHFKVGDTVSVGTTWKIVVDSITTNAGDQFNTPKGQYVIVGVTMTNISGQQQTISSILKFSMRGTDGTQYTETVVGNLAGVSAPPDGKVEAGAPLKGDFTYDVATGVKSFVFSFTPDITANDVTTWDLNL